MGPILPTGVVARDRHSTKRGAGCDGKMAVERVLIGATPGRGNAKTDEWWGRQKGLRQTLRTEVAVGEKGPDAHLDRWAITIRFEDENSAAE